MSISQNFYKPRHSERPRRVKNTIVCMEWRPNGREQRAPAGLTKLGAAPEAGEEYLDVSPFQVGMRCEGRFDDKWYPAVARGVGGCADGGAPLRWSVAAETAEGAHRPGTLEGGVLRVLNKTRRNLAFRFTCRPRAAS